MQQIAVDRRTSERRSSRGGGRRVTDEPVEPTSGPACPACRQADAALLAGEAEGGWWFVCLACDHLWDQRQIANSSVSDPSVIARDDIHLETRASAAATAGLSAAVQSWWKTLSRS